MSRNNFDVFNISFLDLLSGALGAVILLYASVPRMPVSMEPSEQESRRRAQIDKIGHSIEKIRGAIPDDLFERLQMRIHIIKDTDKVLTERTLATKRDLNDCLMEQNDKISEVQRLQNSLELMKGRAEACGETLAEYDNELKFLLVTMQWDTSQDVDLHVLQPDGKYYLAGDSALMKSGNITMDYRFGPGLEVWQTLDILPGTYRLYVNLYSRNGGLDTDGDGREDSFSDIVWTTPNVALRIYYKNGMKEFFVNPKDASYIDRRFVDTDRVNRRTAELVTTLTVTQDQEIIFN